MSTVFSIWESMSTPYVIFVLIVVIATVILLLNDESEPLLLGGEWYEYKVINKITLFEYTVKTRRKLKDSSLFSYVLKNGPIYEGSNRLIHVFALLFLTYWSLWWVLLAYFFIGFIYTFATRAYFFYSGGFRAFYLDLSGNEELTCWGKIGPSEAETTNLKTKNFGVSKWPLFYLLFFIVFIYSKPTNLEIILYIVMFMFSHIFFSYISNKINNIED